MSRETVACVTLHPAPASASRSSCCVPSSIRPTRLSTSFWRSAFPSDPLTRTARCSQAAVHGGRVAILLHVATNTRSDQRANGGLRGAARLVAEHVTSIVKLELELAALEVKKKATSLGLGVAYVLGAVLVGIFMIAFLF